METLNLRISEDQIKIIISALDLYSRLGIGQFEEAIHVSCDLLDKSGSVAWDIYHSPEFAAMKEKITGFPPNANHSICSHKVTQIVKEAYSIEKQLQKAVADRQKVLGSDRMSKGVWGDGDILGLGKLPQLEIIYEKEENRPQADKESLPKIN